MLNPIRAGALFLLATGWGPAAQDPPSAPPFHTNLPLKALSPGVFELGLVRLDQQRRAISLPAFVNMREGALEYVLVTSNGKTHESLLRTDAEPYHIHVAMLLLGAGGAGTKAFPGDPARTFPGDKITIEVVWKKKARELRGPAETFVRDLGRKSALHRGGWVYTGSRLRDDGFAAQADGSIVSLISDPDALVNNPRAGRESDDNWMAKPGKLPAFNQPVQVLITLSRQEAATP